MYGSIKKNASNLYLYLRILNVFKWILFIFMKWVLSPPSLYQCLIEVLAVYKDMQEVRGTTIVLLTMAMGEYNVIPHQKTSKFWNLVCV